MAGETNSGVTSPSNVAMRHGPTSLADPRPAPDMVIDVVDEDDRPIGTIRREQALPSGAGFRVVHAFIFDASGRLLLQQLSHRRERYPGHWGSSVAGYVFSGETYDRAMARRLAQELGLADVEPRPFGKTSMLDQGSRKFIHLFTLDHNGPFSPDEDHIEALEFLSIDEIEAMRRSGARRFTPTFLHVLDFFLP